MEVREQLGRILASPQFSTARRLSAFLEFVVQATLDGQQVKESLIGVEVYGRDPSYNPKTDSIVRAEASRLRAKLREYYSESGQADPLVIDLPKGNYTPAFERRGAPAAVGETPPRPVGARGRVWVAAVVVLVAVAAGSWWLVRRWVRPAVHTIAIMPIRSVGADRSRDPLTDSLTTQLTRALLKSKVWNVVEHAPQVDLTVRDQELAVLRRASGADVVLTGSLQALAKPHMRLTLELVNVTDGYLVWRESYDRTMTLLAESQEELAQLVVEALTARYTGHPAASSDQSYRLAREHWSTYTVEGLQQSLGLFQKAIEADPRSAAAWAGYADANIRLADDSPVIDTRDKVDAARRAALKAIELDPSNAEAQGVLGRIYLYKDWNFPGAVTQLQRAVALDPARMWPSVSYSQALSITGDLKRAQEVIQAARARLSPIPDLILQEGAVFFLARKFDRMEELGRELIALEPDRAEGHWLVGLSLEQRGRVREAIEEFQRGLKAAARDELRTLCALSHAYGITGDRARAMETLHRFLPPGKPVDRFTLSYCAALTHVSLGEKEQALEWLETAEKMKDSSFPFFPNDARFDGLRGEARYQRLASGLRR